MLYRASRDVARPSGERALTTEADARRAGADVAVPWTRFVAWSLVCAAAYVLVVGVVTAVVPSPFFDRQLAVDGWNVASLVAPAILFGPLAATYLVPWPSVCPVGGRAGTGGVLSVFAAGCPVCNKLVVLALGTTGAVEYFRPVQPALGALSVVLVGLALRSRWPAQPARRRWRASATPGGT
jgi:hypothetical protein